MKSLKISFGELLDDKQTDKLQEMVGRKICYKCKGKRFTSKQVTEITVSVQVCDSCGGSGYTDWLDTILRNKYDTKETRVMNTSVGKAIEYLELNMTITKKGGRIIIKKP